MSEVLPVLPILGQDYDPPPTPRPRISAFSSAESLAAFAGGRTAADITNAFDSAVHNVMADFQGRGLPVARYDAENDLAYIEHPDGAREYVNG